MADRATLLALAERCEAATGPDRELDADIALACGVVRERIGSLFYGHKDHSVLVLERDYYDHGGNAPELAAFTGSLDAALTLVPEIVAPETPAGKWPATVDMRRHDDGTATVSIAATDATPEFADDELWVEVYAATPALALCAASLRALAAQPHADGGAP